MGFVKKCLFLTFAFLVGFFAYQVSLFFASPPLPKIDDDTYWGPGKPKNDNVAVVPFTIKISDEALKDLKDRLARTRELAPPLEGTAFEYGFNTRTLKTILEFWQNSYDWRKREAFLNKFPQFQTEIQGLKIHFIHVKPKTNLRTVPLLILHGWPGSIREFYDLIPLLTTPQEEADFVFEVVIPSLPGYGFSQPATKPGMDALAMGVVFKNLMKRLGHERFYVQGGDWGSAIGSAMATVFPDTILGYHSNLCISFMRITRLKQVLGSFIPGITDESPSEVKEEMKKTLRFWIVQAGYLHIQATKPDTVGVALTDSPAGLAAYILEKFSTWTDEEFQSLKDGGLQTNYTFTDLLDNVNIYWFTNSITSSMRLYAEQFSKFPGSLDNIPSQVPTACVRFQNEISIGPSSLLRDKFPNLVHYNRFNTGGHFAAFQVPYSLALDIWKAVTKMEAMRKQKM